MGCSSKLLLPDPSIDASDLGLKVGLHGLKCLILPLEFRPNIGIHLVVSISQFIHSLSSLLLIHLAFDIDLVPHVLHLSGTFFLLMEKSIHQVSDLYF